MKHFIVYFIHSASFNNYFWLMPVLNFVKLKLRFALILILPDMLMVSIYSNRLGVSSFFSLALYIWYDTLWMLFIE